MSSSPSSDKRDQLVLALQQYQTSQQQLVTSKNAQQNAAIMLGLANRADNMRLERQQQILSARLAIGERVLGDLKVQVEQQGDNIKDVQFQVQQQDNSIQGLEQRVEQQRTHLEKLAQEYKRELQEQRAMIQQQKAEFAKMMLDKLKQDMTLDAVIMLAAWIIAQTPLVGIPIGALATLTGTLPLTKADAKTRRNSIEQIAKFAVIMLTARSMRVVAARNGLHNNVGNTQMYLTQIYQAIANK